MSQQVQELIEKIKNEGSEQAQIEAIEVETQAQREAKRIVDDANKQAKQKLAEAEEEIKKFKESAQTALKQASRDTLLTLRKHIQGMLSLIIREGVQDSLSAEKLAHVIEAAINTFMEKGTANTDVHVVVSEKDLETLKHGFLAKLQKALKNKTIRLQSSEDMSGGFTISFDGGKSSFDFSDASLTDYLSSFLNERVAKLLKDSIS